VTKFGTRAVAATSMVLMGSEPSSSPRYRSMAATSLAC
jgi:hypothetical protein